MSYQDKSLQCSDCAATFTFSAEEQDISRPGAILTSPSVVPLAERQGRQHRSQTVVAASITEAAITTTVATVHLHDRCFPSSALLVAKTLKCLLNPVAIDLSTVQIVTARQIQ